ncbi:methyltransferase family protein [Microcella putealis]|uniref:Methyltransferase family protein n=1 Tax=Microcella putealis TaxID=337005 RepID=A0A4V2EX02_9MICO|nr:methyltransferase domain-containing protein [Microcella putealis]RZS57780.1 methyltransferase family protein [Microcella putealis]TQM24847.1 methyltransferase family protein [Microcella putealis]
MPHLPHLLHLRHRADDAHELMDAPDCDPVRLEHTFRRFALVNAIVSDIDGMLARDIAPVASARPGSRPVRLLDVGTGGADVPRALIARARRRGIDLEVVAIDPDERAIAFARSQPRVDGLTLRVAHTGDLIAEGERFDVVMSNHVVHHLDAQGLGVLLADSERLVAPGGVVVHRDLARSRLGYVAFAVGTALVHPFLLRGSFIRPDGLTSIRRSHTVAELAAAAPDGWQARGGGARWRLELRYEAPDA